MGRLILTAADGDKRRCLPSAVFGGGAGSIETDDEVNEYQELE